MARRTKEEAQATRNAILDAAERVFSRRGVSRSSLTDIADLVGMTRGAIYWHFKDKADVLNAMLRRVTLPMEEAASRTGIDPAVNPLGHLRSCLVSVLRRTAADPQCRRVFDIVFHKCEYVDVMAAARDRRVEMRAGCLAEIERDLRNAIRRGQLPRSVRPRGAAVGLHALIDGLIANWVLDPKSFALAREAGHLIDAYLDGIGRESGRGPRRRDAAQLARRGR